MLTGSPPARCWLVAVDAFAAVALRAHAPRPDLPRGRAAARAACPLYLRLDLPHPLPCPPRALGTLRPGTILPACRLAAATVPRPRSSSRAVWLVLGCSCPCYMPRVTVTFRALSPCLCRCTRVSQPSPLPVNQHAGFAAQPTALLLFSSYPACPTHLTRASRRRWLLPTTALTTVLCVPSTCPLQDVLNVGSCFANADSRCVASCGWMDLLSLYLPRRPPRLRLERCSAC